MKKSNCIEDTTMNLSTPEEIIEYCIKKEILTLSDMSHIFKGVTRERVRQICKSRNINREAIFSGVACKRQSESFKQVSGDFWEYIPNSLVPTIVTSSGKIFRLRRRKIKGFRYVELVERSPTIFVGKGRTSYLKAVLSFRDGTTKSEYVHRLVATAFVGNPHNHPQVNHIDGNGLNNHYANLEWCTSQQNMRHARQMHGSWGRGKGAGEKKLTEQSQTRIIELYVSQSLPAKDIAKAYNVSVKTVYNYVRDAYGVLPLQAKRQYK